MNAKRTTPIIALNSGDLRGGGALQFSARKREPINQAETLTRDSLIWEGELTSLDYHPKAIGNDKLIGAILASTQTRQSEHKTGLQQPSAKPYLINQTMHNWLREQGEDHQPILSWKNSAAKQIQTKGIRDSN